MGTQYLEGIIFQGCYECVFIVTLPHSRCYGRPPPLVDAQKVSCAPLGTASCGSPVCLLNLSLASHCYCSYILLAKAVERCHGIVECALALKCVYGHELTRSCNIDTTTISHT